MTTDLFNRLRDEAFNPRNNLAAQMEFARAADALTGLQAENQWLQCEVASYHDAYEAEKTGRAAESEFLRTENQRLREALLSTAASLAAAISLLDRGGKAVKKEAPSDKMFDQMLADYRKSLGDARAALRSTEAS